MEYIARSTLLSEVPAVFVAYLEVLKALAQGPQGAQVRLSMGMANACSSAPSHPSCWVLLGSPGEGTFETIIRVAPGFSDAFSFWGLVCATMVHRPPLKVSKSRGGCPEQIMFEQLRPGNTYAIISWNSMFHVMKQYCLRFMPDPDTLVRAPEKQDSFGLNLFAPPILAQSPDPHLFINVMNKSINPYIIQH
jgi:hypothetical protein